MRILCQRENEMDCHGQAFTPESLKANDGKRVPLTRNFDPRTILGEATLSYVEGEGLYAEIDAQGLEGLQVAIGGVLPDFYPRDRSIMGATIEKCEVNEVAAVESAADETLPRIGEGPNG